MRNIGALAHVLLAQLKTAVIMIGSLFLFGSHYSNDIFIIFCTKITMVENDSSTEQNHAKYEQSLPLVEITKSLH